MSIRLILVRQPTRLAPAAPEKQRWLREGPSEDLSASGSAAMSLCVGTLYGPNAFGKSYAQEGDSAGASPESGPAGHQGSPLPDALLSSETPGGAQPELGHEPCATLTQKVPARRPELTRAACPLPFCAAPQRGAQRGREAGPTVGMRGARGGLGGARRAGARAAARGPPPFLDCRA